jgi:hypothetical protein
MALSASGLRWSPPETRAHSSWSLTTVTGSCSGTRSSGAALEVAMVERL